LLGINVWTLLMIGLASFRLTRLVVFDKITEFIRRPFLDEVVEVNENGDEEVYILPKEKGIRRWIGELLSCYWCSGIWCSAFLVGLYLFYPIVAEPLIVILAVASVAAIIETFIQYLLG